MALASGTALLELQQELDAPFALQSHQINFYAESGYIKLKGVFSPSLLEHYRQHVHARVS